MKSFISLLKKSQVTGLFVTAADTHVGKTTVALQILDHLKQNQWQTTAIKPIASGCQRTALSLRNDDALQLQRACTVAMPYHHVNPIAFEPPIAPHLAASMQHPLSADRLYQACLPALQYKSDITIVEGAGGLMCPLNDTETTLDFVKLLGFPLILVVPIKLGCLNQTLLLHEVIQYHKVDLFGWVANCIDPNMLRRDENIQWLKKVINKPLLDTVEHTHQLHTKGSPFRRAIRSLIFSSSIFT